MPESDPLTQYLNVVYDVQDTQTIILDTKLLPTRQSRHIRPQTARPSRPTALLNPTDPQKGRTRLRPQTARPDVVRPTPPNAPSKSQLAEQKHIRRRLDAFLIGDKQKGQRVFVGITPDNGSNQLHEDESVMANYANVPLAFQTRSLRPRDDRIEYVYNFDPTERMIHFQKETAKKAPEQESSRLSKLQRRLNLQTLYHNKSSSTTIPWVALRYGMKKQHAQQSQTNIPLDNPKSPDINRRIDPRRKNSIAVHRQSIDYQGRIGRRTSLSSCEIENSKPIPRRKKEEKKKTGEEYVEEYKKAAGQQRLLGRKEKNRRMSISSTPIPTMPDKISGDVDYLELWRKHISTIGLPSTFGDVETPSYPSKMSRPKSAPFRRVSYVAK